VADFSLDPRLAADTMSIGVIDNIDVRLMRDRRYWWLVLVPQIAGAQEWQDLPTAERHRLLDVSMRCAEALRGLANADKMNVAALGNMFDNYMFMSWRAKRATRPGQPRFGGSVRAWIMRQKLRGSG
jgi:hypothetical protein